MIGESAYFSKTIITWYAEHRRNLPWRDIKDPYRIWLSEIILQQTQVTQGYDYYQRFVRLFPDVHTLAEADEDKILNAWQGLGYYNRARNLHAAARQIVEVGEFPRTFEGVRALKGVGDYTAAAICSFAYDMPYAVVDGNVFRVLSRYQGITEPIDTAGGKRYFRDLAQRLIDYHRPGLYNQAIMDFGALQCTPKSPHCNDCPLAPTCVAFEKHLPEAFPVKLKRRKVRARYFAYVLATDGFHYMLKRRPVGDIWAGLYEPPLIEFDHSPTEVEAINAIHTLFRTSIHSLAKLSSHVKHVLTHRIIWADFYVVHLSQLPVWPGYVMVESEELNDYPVPRLVEMLLQMAFDRSLSFDN